jgi:TonB family protein
VGTVSVLELVDRGDEGRRAFRRFLLASAVAHLAVALAFLITPRGRTQVALPGVMSVSLVAAPAPAGPPAAAKPKALPAPARPAPPPPPPPPVKTKVLPKEPSPTPKVKPKAQAKPKPAPPKPEAKEETYEDLLADLREERGEEAPAPIGQRAEAPTGAVAGGQPGVLVPPEVAAWLRKAEAHVKQAWVLEPGFRLQALETHVEVEVDASGGYIGKPRITRRSGNPWYDESVERAMQKAVPLPAPPGAGFVWTVIFRPEDVL